MTDETIEPTGGVTSPDYVMVPREPTKEWATRLANIRQGQSDTPRCEPPGEQAIEFAAESIRRVLSAAPPSPRSDDGSGK